MSSRAKGPGLTALAACLAAAAVSPAPASAACSCESMALQVAEESNVFCGQEEGEYLDAPGCANLVNPPDNAGCPEGTFPYRCPLGRFDPQAGEEFLVMGWTFQIVATVTEGSTASECTTGQYVAGSATVNGVEVDSELDTTPAAGPNDLGDGLTVQGVAEPSPVPPLPEPPDRDDPSMGADGYTGASELDYLRLRVLDDSGQIWFIDAPQDEIEALTDQLTQAFQFVTFVKPSDGGESCWCRFTLGLTWTDQAPGGTGIALVGANNDCALQDD